MREDILLINGPNLNMLGVREKEKYGTITLNDIENSVKSKVKEKGYKARCFQSNHEGEIIDFIHQYGIQSSGIIINAGAYTHTSIAIRDALLSIQKPIIEVHITNIFKREEFRKHSYISDISLGVICGLGIQSYLLAIDGLIDFIENFR